MPEHGAHRPECGERSERDDAVAAKALRERDEAAGAHRSKKADRVHTAERCPRRERRVGLRISERAGGGDQRAVLDDGDEGIQLSKFHSCPLP